MIAHICYYGTSVYSPSLFLACHRHSNSDDVSYADFGLKQFYQHLVKELISTEALTAYHIYIIGNKTYRS